MIFVVHEHNIDYLLNSTLWLLFAVYFTRGREIRIPVCLIWNCDLSK